MNPKQPFKWRHFQKEIIWLNVRWYLRYPLNYRNLGGDSYVVKNERSLIHWYLCTQ
ncbi:MAG: hypothetical protein QNJ41_13130 [Xenococcaceae cyanobacterium MO_188.B32]|nr:hypothetical protein [Xenococcaceae cyanobacterium MO_188.B32]